MNTHIVITDHGDHLTFAASHWTGDVFKGGEPYPNDGRAKGEVYPGVFGEEECGEAYKGRADRATAIGSIVAAVFVVYSPMQFTVEVINA